MDDVKNTMFSYLYEIALKRDAGAIYVTDISDNTIKDCVFVISLVHLPVVVCKITNEYVRFTAEFPKAPINADDFQKRNKVRKRIASESHLITKYLNISKSPSTIVEWVEPDSIYHAVYLLNKMITMIKRMIFVVGYKVHYKVEDDKLPKLISFATEAYRTNVLEKQRKQRKSHA